jgi:hypothetical protein
MIHATLLSILTLLNDYLTTTLLTLYRRTEVMKYLLVCCMEVRPVQEVAKDAGICRFHVPPFDK